MGEYILFTLQHAGDVAMVSNWPVHVPGGRPLKVGDTVYIRKAGASLRAMARALGVPFATIAGPR